MSEPKKYPIMLSIAGSDPSGGAGIQADIKAGQATGSFVATAIVAVVDENTVGVTGVHPVPVNFVAGQIKSVMEDLEPDAVKIGMLHSPELILTVRDSLLRYKARNIVIDPVMVATSGDPLLLPEAIDTLRDELLPLADVITPNLPEASLLLGHGIGLGLEDMEEAATELGRRTGASVYLKAGHIDEDDGNVTTLTDILYDATAGRCHRYPAPRIHTRNTHGTGCTLSSAIASYLAQGCGLEEACRRGKQYLAGAIEAGAPFRIGHGHGPVNHFYNLRK